MKRNLLLLSNILLFVLISCQSRYKDYANVLRSDNIYEINAFLQTAHPADPKRSILRPKLLTLLKDKLENANPEDQKVKKLQIMLALLKKRPSTRIDFAEMNDQIRKKQIELLQAQIASGKISYNDVKDSPYFTLANTKNNPALAAVDPQLNVNLQIEDRLGDNSPINHNDHSEDDEYSALINLSDSDMKRKATSVLNSLFDNDPTTKECIVLVQNKSDCNIIMRMEGVGNTKFRLPIPAGKENSMVIPKGDYIFTSQVCGAKYASQKTIQKALMVALGNPSK